MNKDDYTIDLSRVPDDVDICIAYLREENCWRVIIEREAYNATQVTGKTPREAFEKALEAWDE